MPLASVFKSTLGTPEIKRMLVEAVCELNAVVLAYGNCEAAFVEDEKKTPCVRSDVVVADVEVPKVLSEPNGNGYIEPLVR